MGNPTLLSNMQYMQLLDKVNFLLNLVKHKRKVATNWNTEALQNFSLSAECSI